MMLANTFCTTAAAAATAALQRHPAVMSCMTAVPSGSSKLPVLVAVPAPGSLGKDLMCLCRKIYWTNGALMYCAFSPVTKEEAAIFLKDPSIINVLSKPVTGTNLLTVAPNGAIIGVQQTVGFLAPQTTPPEPAKTKTQRKPSTITSPQEAQKAPLRSPDLPRSTTTPTKAQKPVGNKAPVVTTTDATLPKINAVFTLADSGLQSVNLNQTPVPTSNTALQPSMEGTIKERASQSAVKDSSVQHVLNEHTCNTLKSDVKGQDFLNKAFLPIASLPKEAISIPDASTRSPQDCIPKKIGVDGVAIMTPREAILYLPNSNLSSKTVNNDKASHIKEPARDTIESSKDIKAAALMKEQSKVQESESRTAAGVELRSNIPVRDAQKVKTDRAPVPPIVISRTPQGNGFVATVPNTKSPSPTDDSGSHPSKVIQIKSPVVSKLSNVLTDVQNKRQNPDSNEIQTRGIKRKASSTTENAEKEAKGSSVPEPECAPLKVKFTWAKRWTVEGGESYFKYEQTPSAKTNSKADKNKRVSLEVDQEIKLSISEEHADLLHALNRPSEENGDTSEQTYLNKAKEAECAALNTVKKNVGRKRRAKKSKATQPKRTPVKAVKKKTAPKSSPRVVYMYPTVQVKLPKETVIINTATGFQFSCSKSDENLVHINHRVPELKPLKKLSKEAAIQLGCDSSCPLLPADPEEEKQSQKTQELKLPPGAIPTLDTLTKNPDFKHIPTGDKIAYLKELLKMQRASLGLSI